MSLNYSDKKYNKKLLIQEENYAIIFSGHEKASKTAATVFGSSLVYILVVDIYYRTLRLVCQREFVTLLERRTNQCAFM